MVTVKENLAAFCFFRPQATRVYIVGDFNGWRDSELPMTRQNDGTWVASVSLPAGDFKFRYRADGEWFVDYAAFGIECGDFGMDSIVRIAPQPVLQKARPTRPARLGRGTLRGDLAVGGHIETTAASESAVA
jgi:1,4-alpha-glucan branching enzyme